MTALTADRDTPEKLSSIAMPHERTGIDSDVFYQGALVVYDQSDGKFKPGQAGTDLIAFGRCERQVTTGTSNTLTVPVRSGIFRFENSASADLIESDDVGKTCYVVDDQTVALTDGSSTRSAAGKIYDVDSDGVWVSINPL